MQGYRVGRVEAGELPAVGLSAPDCAHEVVPRLMLRHEPPCFCPSAPQLFHDRPVLLQGKQQVGLKPPLSGSRHWSRLGHAREQLPITTLHFLWRNKPQTEGTRAEGGTGKADLTALLLSLDFPGGLIAQRKDR